MVAEFIIIVLVAFGLGGLVAKEQVKQLPIALARQPDLWDPAEHKEMIRQCSLSCGKGKLKSYDAVYGACNCK